MKTMKAVRQETGVALIVCLLMMLAILMLGTSGAQIALQEEKASRYERDRLVAFIAAEAALNDAEIDIEKTSRVGQFENQKTTFVAGTCETGLNNPFLGLCYPADPEMFPVWQKIHLGSQVVSVPYGFFTGRNYSAVAAASPSYLIEVLNHAQASEEKIPEAAGRIYRITAIGFGTKEHTQVVLQSYYGRSGNAKNERLGWREILNWEELRDALEE